MVRVTIGLPVYDGEAYLEEMIASVLGQTFDDFELLISDNASTDRTAAICQAVAGRDPRVRYLRQPVNIGAAPNFNALVAEARGEYFKWAAHDDLLMHTFLERCVAALDRDPDAVLAFTGVRRIDAAGHPGEAYRHDLDLAASDPAQRFGELVRFHRFACYEVFGLIRMKALRQTELIGGYSNGDGVLLAHLGLLGRFAVDPAPLFCARRHSEQSQRLIADKRAYDAWFDPANRARIALPHWRIMAGYARVIRDTPLGVGEKLRCWTALGRQAVVYWRRLAGDVKRITADTLTPVRLRTRRFLAAIFAYGK